MLFNVVDNATGLVCEIQVTLRGLYNVKCDGHSTYNVIRTIHGRDPTRTFSLGAIGSHSQREIETGLVLKMDATGVHLPLSIMQGDLTRSLVARYGTCARRN